MTRFRNVSGRVIKRGEAVYVVGDNVHIANAANAETFSGVSLLDIPPDEVFDPSEKLALVARMSSYDLLDDDEDMTY